MAVLPNASWSMAAMTVEEVKERASQQHEIGHGAKHVAPVLAEHVEADDNSKGDYRQGEFSIWIERAHLEISRSTAR